MNCPARLPTFRSRPITLFMQNSGSDMSLPEGWHIVLTGNRAADNTLFRATSGPLRNVA